MLLTFFISRDTLLDYLFKNSKQTIHYRPKTNKISFKIINIAYCKTRWVITPVFVVIFRNVIPKDIAQILSYLLNKMVVIPKHIIKIEKIKQVPFFMVLTDFLCLITEIIIAIPVIDANISQRQI